MFFKYLLIISFFGPKGGGDDGELLPLCTPLIASIISFEKISYYGFCHLSTPNITGIQWFLD